MVATAHSAFIIEDSFINIDMSNNHRSLAVYFYELSVQLLNMDAVALYFCWLYFNLAPPAHTATQRG